MALDKGRDKEVRVIVTFLAPQRQWDLGLSAGALEKLRL
jgi:hypothetical protein